MNRISLLACPALLLALAPDPARACSLAGYSLRQLPRSAQLIATASPDTVAAGPGAVRAPAHAGSAAKHGIHGQVVEVERIGGAAAGRLDPSVRRVVLVAWDYDERCNVIPWAGSARWTEPGTRGFFTGLLRDRAHWAGGLPTFDVHTPRFLPHPRRSKRADLPPDSLLPAEDYFTLAGLLPVDGQSDSTATRAYLPVFRWAERNPALARRFPASEITTYVRRQIAYERLRSFYAPVAGTYRFEARLEGEETPRVFHLRTSARPSAEWNPSGWAAAPAEKREPGKVEGYHFLSCGSLSPDSLAADCGPGRRMSRDGSLSVLRDPEPGPLPRTWRGQVDPRLVGRQFPATDSALHRFLASTRADPNGTPARFVLDEEGNVRVEQTTRLPDGRALHLSGTLVSPETVAEPR